MNEGNIGKNNLEGGKEKLTIGKLLEMAKEIGSHHIEIIAEGFRLSIAVPSTKDQGLSADLYEKGDDKGERLLRDEDIEKLVKEAQAENAKINFKAYLNNLHR